MPGVGAAIAAEGFFSWLVGGTFWANVSYTLLTSVAFNAVNKLFLDKPGSTRASRAGRQVQTRSTNQHRNIVYGEAAVSGPLVYANSIRTAPFTPTDRLYLAVAFVGHEIDSYTGFFLDDDFIPASDIDVYPGLDGEVQTGKYGLNGGSTVLKIEGHLGTATQPVSPLLNTNFGSEFTSVHQGKGVAYGVFEFWGNDANNAEVYEGGAPRNARALVKGKMIYDPRLDSTNGGSGAHRLATVATWEWSDNPILCIADYLRDSVLGAGWADATIDWPQVISAADYCDVLVAIPVATTEKRFTCNGVLNTGSDHAENLRKLLSSCNGNLIRQGATWYIDAGRYNTPTITLTQNHLRGDITLKTQPEAADRYNTVRGQYYDPLRDHQLMNFLEWQIASFVTRDNGEELFRDLTLEMTNSEYMAQRIAYKLVLRSDQQKMLIFPGNFYALQVAVGDTVQFDIDEFSWSTKTFRCIGYKLGEEEGVDLVLQEDDSASYTDPVEGGYGQRTAAGVITFPSPGVPSNSAMVATSVQDAIDLTWTLPFQGQNPFDETIIYGSDTDQWSASAEIGRTKGDTFREARTSTDARYYWTRNANTAGTLSLREPNSDTSTITASATLSGPAISNTAGTLGLKINVNSDDSSNPGEAALFGFDAAGDADFTADGFINWDGAKITVPRDPGSAVGTVSGGGVGIRRVFIIFDTDKPGTPRFIMDGAIADAHTAFAYREPDGQWYYDDNVIRIAFTPIANRDVALGWADLSNDNILDAGLFGSPIGLLIAAEAGATEQADWARLIGPFPRDEMNDDFAYTSTDELFTRWTDESGGLPHGDISFLTGLTDAPGGVAVRFGNNSGDDAKQIWYHDILIPYDGISLYELGVVVRKVAGTGGVSLSLRGVAADGVTAISNTGADVNFNQHQIGAANVQVGSTFEVIRGYVQGHSAPPEHLNKNNPTDPGQMYDGVVFIQPGLYLNAFATAGQMDIAAVWVRRIPGSASALSGIIIDKSFDDHFLYANGDALLQQWAKHSGGLPTAEITQVTGLVDAPSGVATRFGNDSGDDMFWGWFKNFLLPYDGVSLYEVGGIVRQIDGTGHFSLGLEGVAEDGVTIINRLGADDHGNPYYLAASSQSLTSSFETFRGFVRGTLPAPTAGQTQNKNDPVDPGVVRDEVVYVRPMFRVNAPAEAGRTDLAAIWVRRLPGSLSGLDVIDLEDANQTTGEVPLTITNIAAQGWSLSSNFTALDADTAQWGAGTLTTADGTAFSIAAGNTGNMSAVTYIFLDTAVSSTVLQTTTNAPDAIGSGRILIGVAQNKTDEAYFNIFGGRGTLLSADMIAANAITANELTSSLILGGLIATLGSGNRVELEQDSAGDFPFWIGSGTKGTVSGTPGSGAKVYYDSDADVFTFEGEVNLSEVKTFTPSAWVGFSTDPSNDISYIDLGSFVLMFIVGANAGTSDATTFNFSGAPSAIRPANTVNAPTLLVDNGQTIGGRMSISNVGNVFFDATDCTGTHLTFNAAGFTASGSKGLPAGWSFLYPK